MSEISPTIVWACIGIALLIVEVFSSTFFILFFGIAALLVSLTRVIGINDLPTELILFAVFGVAGTLVFRKRIVNSFASKSEVKIDRDKLVTLSEDIAAGDVGTIIYRGSPWKALNSTEYNMKKGEKAQIESVDGIQLVLVQK